MGYPECGQAGGEYVTLGDCVPFPADAYDEFTLDGEKYEARGKKPTAIDTFVRAAQNTWGSFACSAAMIANRGYLMSQMRFAVYTRRSRMCPRCISPFHDGQLRRIGMCPTSWTASRDLLE